MRHVTGSLSLTASLPDYDRTGFCARVQRSGRSNCVGMTGTITVRCIDSLALSHRCLHDALPRRNVQRWASPLAFRLLPTLSTVGQCRSLTSSRMTSLRCIDVGVSVPTTTFMNWRSVSCSLVGRGCWDRRISSTMSKTRSIKALVIGESRPLQKEWIDVSGT